MTESRLFIVFKYALCLSLVCKEGLCWEWKAVERAVLGV